MDVVACVCQDRLANCRGHRHRSPDVPAATESDRQIQTQGGSAPSASAEKNPKDGEAYALGEETNPAAARRPRCRPLVS